MNIPCIHCSVMPDPLACIEYISWKSMTLFDCRSIVLTKGHPYSPACRCLTVMYAFNDPKALMCPLIVGAIRRSRYVREVSAFPLQ